MEGQSRKRRKPKPGGRPGGHPRERSGRAPDMETRDPRTGPLPEWPGLWYEALYTRPEGRRGPSWREIEQALRTLEHVRRQGQDPVYRYWNPDTHVECFFHGYEPEEPDEVGLAFVMPQPRPEHFAHEALPAAVQVARELRLDMALDDDPEEPTKELLLADWLTCNKEALEDRERDHGPLPGCDRDDLEVAWEYLILREELERRYGRRGVVVPGIEFLRHKKTGRVFRTARWLGLKPTVLPPVDLVYLERPPAPLRTGKILAVEDLSEGARRWVRDVAQPIFHRICLEESPPEEMLQALADMEGSTMRSYDPVRVEDLKDL